VDHRGELLAELEAANQLALRETGQHGQQPVAGNEHNEIPTLLPTVTPYFTELAAVKLRNIFDRKQLCCQTLVSKSRAIDKPGQRTPEVASFGC